MIADKERAQCEATLRLVLTLASKLSTSTNLNPEQAAYVIILAYLSGARFSDILDRIESQQSLPVTQPIIQRTVEKPLPAFLDAHGRVL